MPLINSVNQDEVDQASHQLAWMYQGGTKTTLAKLTGYDYSFPTAVNARGDVVGAAMGDAGDDTVPVLWPADQPGTVRALAMPAGYGSANTGGSQATGLTDDGTVVGTVRAAATRWSPDGTATLLPLPPGHRLSSVASLRGPYIYGSAAVTGENRTVALRWDLGLYQVSVEPGVPDDIAGSTPSGWLITIGGDLHQPTRVNPQAPWSGCRCPRGLLPLPQGPGAFAISISDDGAVITGGTATSNRHLLIWHC